MNDPYLTSLRQVPKRITSSPRVQVKELNRGYRLNLDAESQPTPDLPEAQRFRLFFRQSIDLPERFSAGLEWLRPPTTDVYLMLARYNGVHTHTNVHTNGRRFHGFHQHVGLAQFLDHPTIAFEHHAELAAYADYGGAVRQLLADCGIVNGAAFLTVLGIPAAGAGQQGELFNDFR